MPLIAPGETVYSFAARTHKLNPGSSPESIGRALFGIADAYRYAAVPAGLAQLLRVLGTVGPAETERLLKGRTLLVPFWPLLPAAKRSGLLSACEQSLPANAQTRSGLNRFPSLLRLMKYCATCVQRDFEDGESRWLALHQRPGAWICTRHAKLLNFTQVRRERVWLSPHDCIEHSAQPNGSVDSQLRLLKVQAVIDWFCDRSSAETAILQVMLRWRLRSAGLVRSELKWLASEIAHLRALAHSYFTECHAPDIAALNAQEWLSTVLRERRHYNPLSWAMALAFSGDVSSKTLSREYDEAVARKPDADMFDPYSRRPRRNSAPASVYAAFASADYKSQAVERSGLTDHEIDGWLRKDQHLRINWTSTRSARRRTNAIKQIRAFTAAWPAARRRDVLRETVPCGPDTYLP